ncbi:hypothetical protein EGR_10285 [Echinococcus granulosus]|uniref:Uncharacterized protein n=1 Tax=Echinococcus granulosus TaxID=6210 RepID=W6U8P8_ECHGR|nr:hypothetical protein EGR_10285 [Echinococcus granulosus]EUB54867.1 hypothetical protein EGR_10285 [Echinococcus granulosus]
MAHSAIRRFRLLRPTSVFQLFTLTHFSTTTSRCILIDATPPVGHRCRPPSKTTGLGKERIFVQYSGWSSRTVCTL